MGLFDYLTEDSGGPLRITVRPPGVADPPPVPDVGRPLLKAIAGSESPSYNTIYGGGTFDDFSDHPRKPVRITSGPNAGKYSTAAGLYQFLAPTWDEVSSELNLPDFSEKSQDAGAWHLANKTYKKKTGRDLEADLTKTQGNPNAAQAIAKALSGTWTSLPGGIEPNSMTNSFASRLDERAGAPVRTAAASAKPAGLFDYLIADTPSPPADTGGGRFSDTAGQSFRGAREGASPPVATGGEAFGRGAARGVTFNFLDELNALARAGGLDPTDEDGVKAAIGLIKGGYRLATGDKDAQDTYRAEVSKQRADTERIAQQQPGASLGGELTGAIATAPFTGPAGAVTRWGRAGQAALGGAITGGLSGIGEGTTLGDRAMQGVTGTTLGGTIGAVAAPVMDLAARGVGTAAREAGRYLFPNVETRSATMADNIRKSAERIDPTARTRLTAAEAAATPDAVLADTLGEPGKAAARYAANVSPEGREILNAKITPRFEQQTPRFTSWLNDAFHYPNATAQKEALEQAARGVNNARYKQAYSDGAGSVWSPELERLVGSDAVTAAMQRALKAAKDEAVVAGHGAMNPRFTVSPTGIIEFHRSAKGIPVFPDLQFWDLVRRELSGSAKQAARAGNDTEARRLGHFAKAMNAELDNIVPSYQTAREGAAGFFGADNALDAGKAFITSKLENNEARRALAKMSPTERQLFQDGAISQYKDVLMEVKNHQNILNSVNQSPAATERLAIAFGSPQKSREFEAMVRTEKIMDFLRTQTQGNSTTARQLVEMGAVGTYGGVGAYMQGVGDPQHLVTTLIAGAFVGRGRNTDQRVAKRLAEMLVSNDPQILQKGLSIAARNKTLMDGIRALDNGIGRIGGQQSTGVQALQSMGIGRAEGDQPSVPGP